MRQWIVLSISAIVIFAGCTKRATAPKPTAKSAEGKYEVINTVDRVAQPENHETFTPLGSLCPNGEIPKVLTGACRGTWRVIHSSRGPMCEFVWGPMVSCPLGTVPQGPESACAGVTEVPVNGAMPRNSAECADRFGMFPKPPTYSLNCCPT